ERFREHVLNPRALDHGTHRAARDETGAFGRWLQQHAARSKPPDHLMRNRRALERHLDQVLLGGFDPLLDRRRHFLRLADAEPYDAVPITHHDERAEAEILAALDDLRHAIDRDDGVLDLELRG